MQRSEVRSQRSEVRDQKSEVRSQNKGNAGSELTPMVQHRRKLMRAIAFYSAFCILTSAIARAQEVSWRNDYNRARQEAAEKGVPLLIDIGTENCYWCKQLDLRTFKDPA